jgi:hypothetical protein
LTPIVLRSDHLPPITPAGAKAKPWLAVLAAVARDQGSSSDETIATALDAMAKLRDSKAIDGYGMLKLLSPLARRLLEVRMQVHLDEVEFRKWLEKKLRAIDRRTPEEQIKIEEARYHLFKICEDKLFRMGTCTTDDEDGLIDDCGDHKLLEDTLVKVASAPDAKTIKELLAVLATASESADP